MYSRAMDHSYRAFVSRSLSSAIQKSICRRGPRTALPVGVVVGQLVDYPLERRAEDVELGVGEHPEEVAPDGGDVARSYRDNGEPAGLGEADHRAAGVVGARLTHDEATLLH